MSRVPVREVGYDMDGWGTGLLWFADRLLVWHELPGPRNDSRSPGAPQPTTRFYRNEEGVTRVIPDCAETATIVQQLVERLYGYFAGESVGFADVEIDLDWCTPFQRAIAETLRAVPHGEVVTYGELAALAGHPNAQRAAGTFCAHNRLPLVIPCHRVVAADGIGSYGSLGQGFKRRLLALEGVFI
jgi:methylated-DNA-[protein]-cysteine S-methyltransferase